MKIEFYRHTIGTEEKKKVAECLDGLFLTTGTYVNEFEEKFAAYLDVPYVVGLTSCTAALHLALLALDVGEGDEVITTPMTFIATASAILHVGAKPVFVDVEPATGLMNTDLIEEALTSSTKAILPVHLYGQMCDMVRIRSLADQYNLSVIEDCAHCVEGERDGVRPGHLGDVACFSFYATKNITSGEGGAAASRHKELAQKILLLRQHGMSKEAASRYSGTYKHWDMVACGWKYNMDNIHAALLLPQLGKIDGYWRKREKLFTYYNQQLSGIEGIETPQHAPGSKSAYHLFTVWVDKEKRDRVLKVMGESGIGVAVNYRAIHLLTYLKKAIGHQPGDFPAAEKIGSRTISLPFWVNLQPAQVDMVLTALKNALNSSL